MDPVGDGWRAQLQPVERSRVVTKIKETLKNHLPVSMLEGLDQNQLRNLAARFEEKIYTIATDKRDYCRKISLKVLSLESLTSTQQNHGSVQVITNQIPSSPAPGLPPEGTDQAHASSILLMSQKQTQQQNTVAFLQASSLPNLGQSFPGGSAQGPQDVSDAQRQLEGEQQQQQKWQRLESLLQLQQDFLMKQVDSQASQHHDCHTKQMHQTSLPSMSTRVQSVASGVQQHIPEPQVTNFGVPIRLQNFRKAPQAGSDLETAHGNNFIVQQGSVSDVLHQGSTRPISLQGAMSSQQQSSGNILSHNSMPPVADSMQASAITLQQLMRQRQLELMKLQQQLTLRQMLQRGQRQVALQPQALRQQQAQMPITQKLQQLSPQISHDSSQVDEQGLFHLKATSPLHSPAVPSPSPLVARSPVPLDSDKSHPFLSSVTNSGKAGHQNALLVPQTLSIIVKTPGSGASDLPLLAEFKSADGSQGKVESHYLNSSAAERPLDRLLKKYIYLTVKLLAASVVVGALLLVAYNEWSHQCRA